MVTLLNQTGFETWPKNFSFAVKSLHVLRILSIGLMRPFQTYLTPDFIGIWVCGSFNSNLIIKNNHCDDYLALFDVVKKNRKLLHKNTFKQKTYLLQCSTAHLYSQTKWNHFLNTKKEILNNIVNKVACCLWWNSSNQSCSCADNIAQRNECNWIRSLYICILFKILQNSDIQWLFIHLLDVIVLCNCNTS